MAKVSRFKIAKDLIDEGRLHTFEDIFSYVTKSDVSKGVGMNYTRLLRIVKDPLKMTFADGRAIAKILGVNPRQIANLAYNQVEIRKPRK